MTFFYDLNKRLANIAKTEQLNEDQQVTEKYMGFSKLEKDIAKRGDVRDPAAVAASIGRKKYGQEKFQKAAAAGKKLGEQDLQEKWDEPTRVAPSEKGKYKGKTKAELKKQYDRLKASGPHKKGSPEFGRMRELAFAIRAKSDWGKVDEAPNEGNEFSGALAKAKATGAKEFEVDGKTYPVKESELEEGYLDFMDKKEMYRKIGADVEGRSDDYTVTFKDGSRKRYQDLDGRRRVTSLEPVDAPEETDDEGRVVKRGRGRPKGSKRSLGAKGPTGRSKLMTREQNVAEGTGNLASIIRANQRDVDAFMRSGDLSDSLYNVLFDYYMDEMPYGTAKARTGDPYEWISDRFHDDMGGGVTEDYDKDEYDEEGEMAKSQSRTIEDAARELQAMLGDNENMPEWVQKKINLAKEYIDSARDYLKANRPEQDMDESALQAYLGKKKYGEQGMKALQKAGREGASKEKMAKIRASHDKLDEVEIDEKAVSKAQRAAAGIAHAARKGEIPKSELRGASKEMAKMPAGELKKFAKTKEKGLPKKVREEDKEDVEETTTAGSVAPSAAEPKTSKGGMTFGKGIYDSFNRQVEDMIAESMSINASDSTEGGKSLTVTASDEDALKLAAMLKMAGLNSMRSDPEPEGGCGAMEEAYGDVDPTENQPDYPTNTEVSDDALQYSGGLNRPKSTGQTTVPVIASQLDRQVSEETEEIDEVARMREMAGLGEAAKPDFPDIDDDGDEKESIAKAAKDKEKEEEEVNEAVASSLWDLYKRIA
jgi:hypothetical protein